MVAKPRNATTKTRWPSGLRYVLLLAGLAYLFFIGRTSFRIDGQVYFTLIDDAMISMRYAQHLAGGHGLVWNIGEPPVQGFSNPGWVLCMVLPHLLHITPALISLAIMLTSAIVLLASAAISARICQVLAPDLRLAPLMAAMICAFYFPLVFWSLRGMEVGLLVLLISLATLQALRLEPGGTVPAVALGVLLSAAVLVRLDAILQSGLILLYVVATRGLSRSQIVIIFGCVALTTAAILLFQLTYFGDILPNTYYQKLAGASLFERLRAGGLAFYRYGARDVVMMSLISAAGIWFYQRIRTREAALLGSLFAVQCIYSVWIGGDYAEPEVAAANRFISQGVPSLIVLFSLVMDRVLTDLVRAGHSKATSGRGASSSMIALAAAAATLAVISATPWISWAIDNAPLLKADIRRVRAGLAIAVSTSEDASIAVHAAGQIPYYSGRRAIDMLGLNDPIIARGPRRTTFYPGHDKWNYEYSIGQLQPDLIADNWIRLADYIRGLPGYRQLANGMYVRSDTTKVDSAALLSHYP